MSLQIASPFQQFFDRDGSPLDNGFVYIGIANLNPETNPLTVYFDDALTIPAAQPLRTSNGYIVRNGSPARVYTSQEDFSLTVREKNSVLVYAVADATSLSNLQTELASPDGADLVGIADAGGYYTATNVEDALQEAATGLYYNFGATGTVARTVQNRLRDTISVKDFGAVGDGVTNDAPAIQSCLNYCVLNNKIAYAPSGIYLLNAKIAVTGCNRIGIIGDGSGLTRFKRGDNVIATSFTEMFAFTSASAAEGSFVGRGFSLDGNARGNQIPVNITPVSGAFLVGEYLVGKDDIIGTVGSGQLKFTRFITDLTAGETITGAASGATATVVSTVSAFLWQQSHCVRIAPTGLRGFGQVVFEDIYGYDPTADTLGVGGNAINTCGELNFSNIVVDFRQRVRSDITITASYDALSVANCSLIRTEVELNSFNTSQEHATNITNLVTDTLDLAAEQSTDLTGWPKLNVSNTTVREFAFLQNFAANYSNCSFTLTSAFRVARGFAEFNGCKFFVAASFVTPSATQGAVYENGNNTNTRFTAFRGCVFDADPAATFTYYYTANNTWGSGGTSAFCKPYIFDGCTFRQASRAAIYVRSGQFVISDCTFDTAGTAVIQSTPSSVGIVNSMRITNCMATDAAGYIYQPPVDYGGGQPVTIWMDGNLSATVGQIIDFTRYDRIAPPQGAAVAPADVLNFKMTDRTFESAAIPTTGKWLRGQVVWNAAPAPSGKVGWVVTTNGNIGTAVFKPFGAIDA